MKTLQLLPLLLAVGAFACGDGDVGSPPDDSFDETRPLIYSEQPDAPDEKSPTALERPQAQPEANPLGSPFGLDGNGLASPGGSPPSGQGSVPVDSYCNYTYDACYYCNDYSECLSCWEDSATADAACSALFSSSGPTGYCDYTYDACYYCNDYSECLSCWEDSATADAACSTLFP